VHVHNQEKSKVLGEISSGFSGAEQSIRAKQENLRDRTPETSMGSPTTILKLELTLELT
jgi:hypothetical protein